MPGERRSKVPLLATGFVLTSLCGASAVMAAEAAPTGFLLSSSTFKDGGKLPLRIAFKKGPNNPHCLGENISPQLSWSNPPPAVRSFVLTMVDQEAVVHDTDLIVYGIPATITSFAEGELNTPSDKFIGGKSSRNLSTWGGMCPPPGTSMHHYVFKIIATDLDPKSLPANLTWSEVESRLKGHVEQVSALIGTFIRPK